MTNDRLPKKGEGWRHRKGKLYIVDFISYDEESGEPRVQYHDASGDDLVEGPKMYFGRPLSDFLGYDPDTHEKRFVFEREPAPTNEADSETESSECRLISTLIHNGRVWRVFCIDGSYYARDDAMSDTGPYTTIKQAEDWIRSIKPAE